MPFFRPCSIRTGLSYWRRLVWPATCLHSETPAHPLFRLSKNINWGRAWLSILRGQVRQLEDPLLKKYVERSVYHLDSKPVNSMIVVSSLFYWPAHN